MAEASEQKTLLTLHRELEISWRDRMYQEEGFGSEESNDEWWRESSCSSCSDSDYDEWPVMWQKDVNSKGELFYVECVAQTSISSNSNTDILSIPVTSQGHTKMRRGPYNWKKDAQGTLRKLVRRKNKCEGSESKANENTTYKKFSQTSMEGRSNNKVTFLDNHSGEMREVHVLVEPRKHNLGRRASLCETLLGLVPGHFTSESPHDQRIMVAGFIPDTEATRIRKIKIGDWLHSIDGQQVSHQTVDQVLASITTPCMVTLCLQRVAGCDVTQLVTPYLLTKGLEVEQLLQIVCRGSTSLVGGSVLLLSTCNHQNIDETDQMDQVIYCYPEFGQPPIAATRGLFLTLQQLLPEILLTSPYVSTVLLGGKLTHVLYNQEENNLVLLAIPNTLASVLSAKELFSYFIKAINFSYQSFTRTAFENKARLDLLVDCVFGQYSKLASGHSLKEILPTAHLLPLPKETQTDLHNALAEFESADFANQVKSHNSQRLFAILGSCLFYKGWSICSHLPQSLLAHVQALCWLHGLCSLGEQAPPLRRLLAWKQVFLPPENESSNSAFIIPPRQHFVLLLGQSHQILAVLLESIDYSIRSEEIPGLNICYVEQAQATLDAINRLGIADIIENCLESRVCSNESENVDSVSSKMSSGKLMGVTAADQLMRNLRIENLESTSFNMPQISDGSASVGSLRHKSLKVPSILKQHKVSARSSENSDDTCSQSASEGMRQPTSDTSSEDSWDTGQESSITGECALSECNNHLLSQGFPLMSKLVESSSNYFFHYVLLESDLGVLLSPASSVHQNMGAVLKHFHATWLALHNIFHHAEETSHEKGGTWVNHSIAAITELGVSFECCQQTESGTSSTMYWVVGRQCIGMYPREVYVCFQDSISLNVMELAFRLALTL